MCHISITVTPVYKNVAWVNIKICFFTLYSTKSSKFIRV